MFIDYITLMLVNTVAGLLTAAGFFFRGLDSANPESRKPWAAPLAATGLVALLTGLHMTLTWPVTEMRILAPVAQMKSEPASNQSPATVATPVPRVEKVVNLRFANSAFGEISVLAGALMLAAALSVAKGWNLWPVSLYSVVVGIAAIVFGASICALRLTMMPGLTATGYALAGLAAVLVPLAVRGPGKKMRRLVAGLLTASALVWAATAFPAIWMHLGEWSK